MAWQSLFDWCMENGERGEQLLHEFGEGNNEQIYENAYGMMQAPQDYARGSRTKIKWTCRNNSNHVWQASIRNRVILGSNCPYCAGKVASEENNLLEWCKQNGDWGQQIISEWTGLNENNEHVEMAEFTKGSGKRVLWKCSKNHTWYASLHERTTSRYKCPICANMLIVEGINDLKTYCLKNENCKHLIDEWVGIDENGKAIKMSEVAVGSCKKVKWHCTKCLSDWTASIVRRTMDGNGCPVCAGQVIVEGINDLKTWCLNNEEYKHLIDEWVGTDENGSTVKMTEVSKGTAKKVLWKCSNGHEWYASISDRASKHKSMCPKCTALIRSEIASEARTKTGENDLLTWCNENGEYGDKIKAEFTGLDEFGNKIDIAQIAKGSNKIVLWHCSKCGKEWKASIYSRTGPKNRCPYCSTSGTSYPEQFLFRALQQIYPNTINRGKYNGYEYDIMITDTTPNLFIEYSGIYWHADKLDRDELKASICKENNIRFIQIYAHSGQIEINEDIFDENQIIYRVDNDSNIHNQQLTEILQHILNSLGHDISEINIEQAQTEAFNFMHDIEELDEEELEDF